jgi:hypothetical protein
MEPLYCLDRIQYSESIFMYLILNTKTEQMIYLTIYSNTLLSHELNQNMESDLVDLLASF